MIEMASGRKINTYLYYLLGPINGIGLVRKLYVQDEFSELILFWPNAE